jgi:hypothetical protein
MSGARSTTGIASATGARSTTGIASASGARSTTGIASASGALMHLVSFESNSALYRYAMAQTPPLQEANTYAYNVSITDILPSNELLLSRTSDLVLLDYLLVDLNIQPPENTRENIISNYELIISIGGHEKYYPLQILEYLEPSSIISRNILKIPINYDYFINNNNRGLPMICLLYHEVRIAVRHIESRIPINGARLISKDLYLNIEERRTLATNRHEYKSREVQTANLQSRTALKRFDISGNGLINGFILRINQNANIENIENIEIFMNGVSRQLYTSEIINIYCQRLAPNAIYIPINMDTNFRSNLNASSLNLGRIDSFEIQITTNLANGFNATIYKIQPNVLRIMSGMGGYVFDLNTPNFREQVPPVAREPVPIVLNRIQQPANWQVSIIDFEIPLESICPITFDEIDIACGVCKCIQCNNIFGYSAYRQWIETSRNCPVCRNRNIENKYYTANGEPLQPIPHPAVIPIQLNQNNVVNNNVEETDDTRLEQQREWFERNRHRAISRTATRFEPSRCTIS